MLDKVSLLNSRREPSKVFKFSNDEKAFDTLEAKENCLYSIKFEGDAEDKLYIDGLDLIKAENSRVKLDENNKLYISPSKDPLPIYDNKKNNQAKYLPGIYRLKLFQTGKPPLYSWIKVQPKFLSNSELNQLRLDVESTIRGLARSFDANTNGTLTNYNDGLSGDDYELIRIFHQERENFQKNLYGIQILPEFSIANKYRWTSKSNSPLDTRSVQKMASHPLRNRRIFAKSRMINFNIPQNILLKNQLIYILKKVNYLMKKIDYLVKMIDHYYSSKLINQHVSLKKDFFILKKYKDEILGFVNFSWMGTVTSEDTHKNGLLKSVGYRYIFITRFTQKLRLVSSKSSVSFHRQYDYYWHRTDLLYEIWGYIQVVKSMQNIGFKPINGWIFDKKRKYFDELGDGTTVLMVGDSVLSSKNKRSLQAEIIYNKRIPTDKSSKVWTNGRHNWPDIRIDIYDIGDKTGSRTLVGILVLDTKYRKLESVEKDAREQLASYLDQIKTSSKYAFNLPCYENIKKHRVIDFSKSFVSAVGILYPKSNFKDDKVVQNFEDKNMEPIGLIPGKDTKELNDFLDKQIGQLIDKVVDWARW